MDSGFISTRYAKALWLCAKESKRGEELYNLLKLLSESFSDNSNLASVLQNPTLTISRKRSLILTACANSSNPLFIRFTNLILQNGRENELHRIALSYCNLHREASNIYVGKLTTAVPIDNTTVNAIKKRMEKSGKTLEFKTIVNPDILGGFILDLENERLDASVSSQLQLIKNKLAKGVGNS